MKHPAKRARSLSRSLEIIAAKILKKPKPSSIHDLRTTIRRVETVLATVGDGLPGAARLLKQIKRLRRRAGQVRDVDVQLAALRTVQARKSDKKQVRGSLDKLRKKHVRKLVNCIEHELADGLNNHLKRAAKALTDAPAERRHQTEGAALTAALKKFSALTQEYSSLNDKNLHEFRMACKRVRYTADADAGLPAADRAIQQLKRIQDAIGDWHDWLNLAQTAETVLDDGDSPVLAAVLAARQVKLRAAFLVTADAKRQLFAIYAAVASKPVTADDKLRRGLPADYAAAS